MSRKTKRQALRRLRGLVGEVVYILCAKIDPGHSHNPNSAADPEPAIDPSSFTWTHATIKYVPDTEDGDLVADDEIEIEYDDKSTTYYERRFLFTYDEARALKLPKVPSP